MSKAAVSILIFGIYVLLNGITLMAAPNLMLITLHQPPTQEPWLRVFGAAVFVLGLYYDLDGSHAAHRNKVINCLGMR